LRFLDLGQGIIEHSGQQWIYFFEWGGNHYDSAAVEEEGKVVMLSLEPFVSMNRAHVALENGEIFPVAERLLDNGKRAQTGAAMARRRGKIIV